MLIVCTGPDTWSARKKARELVQAFREKHDIQGFSTSILHEVDVPALLQQFGAPSLFSPKRLIRCDGLLDGMKVADSRLLAKKLQEDGDQTILLTVEAEPLAAKTVEAFKETKIVTYAFPQLTGSAFLNWCLQYAHEKNVPPTIVRQVADQCAGDTWSAVQELDKFSANPQAELSDVAQQEVGVFVAADAFLRQQTWREFSKELEPEQVLPMFISQLRSAIRVRDQAIQGLHPYVVKKLSGLKTPRLEARLRALVRAQALQRSGYTTADEIETLF